MTKTSQKNTEIQTLKKDNSNQELQSIDQANQLAEIIKQAVSNPDLDADKLHKLLDFQERVMNKQAEQEFNAAFHVVQLNMPTIKKDNSVSYPVDKNDPNGAQKKAFDYATYENIMKVVKPVLLENGFTIDFDTQEREGGGATVIATLTHTGGHYKKAHFNGALDTSGGKNNIQAMGSTFSYGKRYCLTSLLNIITEGEDNDGNYQDFPIDDAQFEEIQKLIDETNTDAASFCKYMEVTSLKQIKSKSYPRAKQRLLDKKKKMESAGGAS